MTDDVDIEYVEPPAHLSEQSQELWRERVPEHASSRQRQTLLVMALEALDRADEARKQVDEEGLTFVTKSSGTIHIHPLLRVEKDSRALFARLWGQLNLSFDPYR